MYAHVILHYLTRLLGIIGIYWYSSPIIINEPLFVDRTSENTVLFSKARLSSKILAHTICWSAGLFIIYIFGCIMRTILMDEIFNKMNGMTFTIITMLFWISSFMICSVISILMFLLRQNKVKKYFQRLIRIDSSLKVRAKLAINDKIMFAILVTGYLAVIYNLIYYEVTQRHNSFTAITWNVTGTSLFSFTSLFVAIFVISIRTVISFLVEKLNTELVNLEKTITSISMQSHYQDQQNVFSSKNYTNTDIINCENVNETSFVIFIKLEQILEKCDKIIADYSKIFFGPLIYQIIYLTVFLVLDCYLGLYVIICNNFSSVSFQLPISAAFAFNALFALHYYADEYNKAVSVDC